MIPALIIATAAIALVGLACVIVGARAERDFNECANRGVKEVGRG